MKRKGWLVPILVFIFSLSMLFFYQKNQTAVSLASPAELPPILWSESPSNINKITYSYGNKAITVTYNDTSWVLANSNNKKADDLYIYNILNHFQEPVFDEIIEVSPKDLTVYGIDESSPTLTLYDINGNEYSLTRGNSIDESLDYVYAPLSDTVYSLAASNFQVLKTSETDWLNKQLLNFDLKDVTKISFSYKSIQATLLSTTMEDEIIFTSNNISDSLSAEFVHFLNTSKVEKFITNDATANVLEIYGFNNPLLKCTVYLNNGDTTTLTIGTINQTENLCYAMVDNNNSIVAIPYFDFSPFDSLYATQHGTDDLLG